jgi:hypothetical protein
MSLRVLVIPEDPTHNGYILKPLIERMLTEAGKPHAQVVVLTNPKVGGYNHAVGTLRRSLSALYGHFDLWLFCPDADKAGDLGSLEGEVARLGVRLLCCAAKPEIEAWVLAGFRDEIGVPWAEVLTHPRLKETVFEPFVRLHTDPRSAGGGRLLMMRRTLENYRGLLAVCPELQVLENRLRKALEEIGALT